MSKYTQEQWTEWRRQGAADDAYNRAARAARSAAEEAALAEEEAAQDALTEAEYHAFADAREAWAKANGVRGSRRFRYTVATWRAATV